MSGDMGMSESRVRNVMSQSQPFFETRDSWAGASTCLPSGLRVGSLLRTWAEISRINYMSTLPLDVIKSFSATSFVRRRSIGAMPSKEFTLQHILPTDLRNPSDEESLSEQFPVNVTPLLNEDQYWGCFYNFPELYGDEFSPVVRVRHEEDVPEIVGGVLTRDVVTACLTYLKRTPILGDYVYIKLDLSSKHLVNVEVLQHYKYLVYLDLSTNYLTELTVLSHLLYLQFLSVAFNRLSTILEYETPQWFLTEVQYKFNSVKKIRDLSMFWSITILDLSHNNIKSISGLDNLRYLRRLDLSFNHIQRLENLNHLRLLWLDVSYNNMSSYEFGLDAGLWTLLHLEYLNLNENNFISMKMFSGCTRLRELHVRNNRLSILLELAVYMRQMRRLIILDLRANPVSSTPGYKDVVINTFPLLLSLDAKELDPVEQRGLKMEMTPDVSIFASRRLLRLLYIEQLSRARVSPNIPPADTAEVPIIILVGYEAVGKGSLVRRLAAECRENVELALLHTTAAFHSPGHYIEVSRGQFDDMLLAGEFLTYHEMDGESYGLSRTEAFIKEGKVKVTSMALNAALMMNLRGRRPYLILASYKDKIALTRRQKERQQNRLDIRERSELPLEKSTLQVVVSGRILITGILNEILLGFPDEREHSEFVMESECSLLMDSEVRQAVRDYTKGVNLQTLLNSSATSLEEAMDRAATSQNENSMCSIYKESQNTEEYTNSDANERISYQISKIRSESTDGRPAKQDKISNVTQPKSVDFSRYVSSTWKGVSALISTKSSKSVTFTSQDMDRGDNAPTDISGLMIEPPLPPSEKREGTGEKMKHLRSLSTKLPWPAARELARAGSGGSLDDLDLWCTFLIETGLMRASDVIISSDTATLHDTRVEDPDFIIKQLEFYRKMPSHTSSMNITDDYEDIHRKWPGLFWDTVTMDEPNEALVKVKRIIRSIVNSQKELKPMFDIDFTKLDHYPIIKNKIMVLSKNIAPQRFFF